MAKDVIIALDFPSAEETLAFLDKFAGEERNKEIKRRGHKIFLDLKLHDIPNTVGRSMAVLSALDVDMCNLHAGGGVAMMKAALEGLTRADGSRPLLIAVTQLTSTSEEVMHRELWIDRPMDETVMHYAANAASAGLDGVVCSPLGGVGRRGLLPLGGGQGARGVRGGLPHRHSRHPLRRREQRGSGESHHSRKSARTRLRLHRCRTPRHRGGGSRPGIPPLHRRFLRMTIRCVINSLSKIRSAYE